MEYKFALITDIHYDPDSTDSKRRCHIADTLLIRAVFRLNRLVRPQVTLVLGDILNDGHSPKSENNLLHLKSILDKLDSPYLIIPGNHDGDPELFYRVFDRPGDFVDRGGVRFLPFIDRDEPGYNASRSRNDLDRFARARKGYEGPLVALQHVNLFPPDQDTAPYNHTNAGGIIDAMKASRVSLSVSGHYHRGGEPIYDEGVTFINAPGLCESPFPFLVLTMDSGRENASEKCTVIAQRHELALPISLNLYDNHMHTQMAYCSDNMTVKKSLELAKEFGLAGICITEHSGQLYFDKTRYWDKSCLKQGMKSANPDNSRMTEYLELKRTYENASTRFGLEVDCDFDGNLLLKPKDRKHFDFIVGALHHLPGLTKEREPGESDKEDFLSLTKKMLEQDIDVLAHPFRVFRRSGWSAPTELFRPTAQLLKTYGTAAEINFHTNEPPVEFIRICLELDVKFSFASDAHNQAEIGDFAYHLDLLERAGYKGDLEDILIEMNHG
jgi:histidinol phosphatase-like PHP family hydrolase/predicted phosphodiesterase